MDSENVKNPESNPLWNAEPGIAIVPGSNYARYMESHEQFPSKFGANPGNPYRYRPFPKMVYRAERWQGNPACMAAPPDENTFTSPNQLSQAQAAAARFNERCQRIVNNEQELQRALEDNFRESPSEAVEALIAKDRDRSTAAAHRNHEDRNMSEAAKREIAQAVDSAEEHVAEIPRKRGRPRKVS